MLSTNAPITEDGSLQQMLGNAQSTHNSVASSSVGMALLHLKATYFARNTVNISEKYARCLAEMKLAAKNEREKLNAIQFLDNQSNGINDHDKINLYLKNNNIYKTVMTVFPLKEVITLVWLALRDHEKYVHNYTGSNQAQFAAARGEYNLRLESFFICITSMPNDLCHTGIRNDLVFLLNKSYPGIDIIEDARSTIYMIIKEHTNKLFWEHFQAVKTSIQKKVLTQALMIWISNDNPVPLLDMVDKDKILNKSLATLFIKHGTDPAYIKLDELIAGCLPNVKFNYDPEQHPIINTMEKIIISAVGETDETILMALKNFKQWLIDCFDLQDNAQHKKIMAFYYIYHAYKNADEHNNMLLTITGNIEAGFHDLAVKCKAYFTPLAQKDLRQEFPLPTDNLVEIAERFGIRLASFKANTMYEQIVNFFVNWNYERFSRPSQLYHLFLDEEVFQSKVILKDEEIAAFLNISDPNNPYRDITPYQINRIFLHAIIVSVSDWSDKFGYLFLEVLKFVKNNFNGHSDASLVINNLRRDSYRDILINQLNYYAECFTCIKNQTPNTLDEDDSVNYLLLPQHVKTMKQWTHIYSYMSKKKCLEICERYKIKINQILFQLMSRNYGYWQGYFDYIPAQYQVKFLMEPRVLDFIINSENFQIYLDDIMRLLDPKELASVSHALASVLKFKCEDNFIEVYGNFINQSKLHHFTKSLMLLYVFSIVDETTDLEKLQSDQNYWSETFSKVPPAKRLAFLMITENKQFMRPYFIEIIKSHLSENDYYRFLTEVIIRFEVNTRGEDELSDPSALVNRLNKFVYTFVKAYSALRAAQTSFFKSADWAKENNILELPAHEALGLIYRHAYESPHSRTNKVLKMLWNINIDNTHAYNHLLWGCIYDEGFKRSGIFKKSGYDSTAARTANNGYQAVFFKPLDSPEIQSDKYSKTRRGKIFRIMHDKNGEGLKEHLAKKDQKKESSNPNEHTRIINHSPTI